MAPFGNDPAKIHRYRAFWNRDPVSRPLVGFTLVGWFPFQEFAVCRSWGTAGFVTPGMIRPEEFLDDHLRILREGETMDDDLIRGSCPAQVAIPWLPAMLGSPLRVLPDNVLGEERRLAWDDALAVRLDTGHPWFCKYSEFLEALVRASGGAFPVSHSPEIGPTDLHGALRGHTGSVLDLADEPELSTRLLQQTGEIFAQFFEETWRRLPLYLGGWFDAQYSLWSPAPIVRMQEDATAVYSPALYRRFVQPVDRAIARRFDGCFIHLHSTSMFLLDAFLEVEEIRCYEVNHDALGPPLAAMVKHFRAIQAAGKPLLIRGAFSAGDARLLRDSLDARGLFLNAMVKDMHEVEALRGVLGM